MTHWLTILSGLGLLLLAALGIHGESTGYIVTMVGLSFSFPSIGRGLRYIAVGE